MATTDETLDITAADLRQGRGRAGMSSRELARLAGVSATLVADWEHARRPIPPARARDLERVLAGAAPAPAPMTGAELRALRRAAALSQSDLARKFGVAQKAISLWEHDGPPASRIRELREVLGTDLPPDGEALRAMRERAGWRQKDLAKRAGVVQSSVGRWERSEAPIPRQDWPRIKRLLEDAEPQEAPVTAAELRALLRDLNFRHDDLAARLGISRVSVAVWAKGHQRVSPRWWKAIRKIARSGERRIVDLVGDALPVMLEVIRTEPGLSREEIEARAGVPYRTTRKAIARAIEQRLAHERPVDRLRSAPGLFPGPPPPEWEPGRPITSGALRRARTEAGLSRAELARQMNVDAATIRVWETGKVDLPPYRRAQLRAALGSSIGRA